MRPTGVGMTKKRSNMGLGSEEERRESGIRRGTGEEEGLTHILAVEKSAELSFSILTLSCSGSAVLETCCITDDSWPGPMTEILALGHIHKNRGL